jgi:hypothetical protein
MITAYDFGSIKIDGTTYTNDVIVFPDRVRSNWWRKEGHSLCLEDVKEVVDEKPDVLIVGTGFSGAMQVPDDVRREIERLGTRVIVQNSRQAWRTYNELSESKKAVAAIHLTC